jgi:predicted nucleotidyltransferase
VVAQKDVMAANDRIAHPAGAVGVIVRSPVDRSHAYRVKFSDGFEAPIHHDQLARLSEFKNQQIGGNQSALMSAGLFDRVIYRCVIGSRAYGLEDEASDTDRRGIYLPPAELQWSLYGVPEQLENDETQEVYVLEQIFSPLVVYATPEYEELKSIASGCITKHHAHHYLGFAATQWKLFRKQASPRVKPLLYVYRVLLTGIHLMRTGKIESNLLTLNTEAELPYINDLIAEKLAGPEKGSLADSDLTFHESEYGRLTAELESACDNSTLPEMPAKRDELNDLLIRLRLDSVDDRRARG